MPPSHVIGRAAPVPGPTTAPGDGIGTSPVSADRPGSAEPPADRVPTSAERSDVVLRIIDAAAGDAVGLDAAGHLMSLTYRARRRDDLARIGHTLAAAEEAIRAAARRRRQRWSLVGLVVCVAASVLMVLALLHGFGPLDPS